MPNFSGTPVSDQVPRRSNTTKRLIQAAALASALIPLGAVAVEGAAEAGDAVLVRAEPIDEAARTAGRLYGDDAVSVGDDGALRVEMLETIREFAADRLDQRPDFGTRARRAHATHFADLAHRLRGQLTGNERETALATMAAQH